MPASTLPNIEKIIGKPLVPAPVWPAGPLLGLMAYKKDRPQYELDASEAVIGLNLAGLGLTDAQWDAVLDCLDPACLRALNLADNQLTRFELPASMQALEWLNLSSNGDLRAVSFPSEGLENLRRADLNECALPELTVPARLPALQALNLRFGKLERLAFAGDCPALEVLDARDNQLTELTLPPGLPNLWFLNVDNNQLAELRIPAALPRLTTLNIRDNQLSQLEPLQLSQHPLLDALYIHGNPWALSQSVLPEKREENSIGAIRAYLEALGQGEETNDRVKIIAVGNGRVGKTTLLRRLRDEPMDPHEPYTHGLLLGALDRKEYLPGVKTDTLRASVWDFGGQEIFYATHQFFLTEGALYLLCWTDEQFVQQYRNPQGADRPFDGLWRPEAYWLENIRLHGGDSPVLLVQTHCQRGNLALPAGIDPALAADALRFSADAGYEDRLTELRREMARKINEAIPDFGQPFPKSYGALIDSMAERRKETPFIDRATFDGIAVGTGIRPDNVGYALDFLRRSGVVVYFGDREALKDVVYIDPDWLTNTVYKIFNNELLAREGRFDLDYVNKVLPEKDGYTAVDRARFVQLLLQFELVFEEKRQGRFTGNYVAPQYLPEKLVRMAQVFFDKVFAAQELRFVYRFSRFLPDNVMVNFLSRYGQYSETVIWKEGIWFKAADDPALQATVMLDAKTQTLWVYTAVHPGHTRLCASVLEQFQQLSEQAPAELSIDGKQYVSLEKLRHAYRENMPKVEDVRGEYQDLAGYAFLLEDYRGGPAVPAPAGTVPAERSAGFPSTPPPPVKIDREKLEPFDEPTRQSIAGIITRPEDALDDYLVGLAARFARGVLSQTEYNLLRKAHINKDNLRVIFLAATPNDQNQLYITEEFDKLSKQLHAGSQWERYECLLPKLRLTLDDLQRALADRPGILHFSGHGATDGIYVLDEHGASLQLKEDTLRYLLSPYLNTLGLVFLNACLTAGLAREISRNGPFVIGHCLKVTDPAAIAFTEGFYIGLGEHFRDYRRAFHAGKARVLAKYPREAAAIEVWVDGQRREW